MVTGYVPGNPDPARRGELHGRRFRSAIRRNIEQFTRAVQVSGWDTERLRRAAAAEYRRLDLAIRTETQAIAAGAAVGSASASRATVLLKNSDKTGTRMPDSEGFFG